MPYTVEFLKTAEEELVRLPTEAQRRIVRKLEELRGDPRPAGVKQLRSPEKFLRIRVGDYRVIYLVEGKRLVVLVVSIGDRKETYRNVEVLVQRVQRWRQARTSGRTP